MADVRRLESRRATLLARCAVQRSQLSGEAAPVLMLVRRLDDGLQRVRRLVTQPLAIVLGIVVMALVIRSGPLRAAGKTLGLASAAWRAGNLAVSAVRRLRSDAGASIQKRHGESRDVG